MPERGRILSSPRPLPLPVGLLLPLEAESPPERTLPLPLGLLLPLEGPLEDLKLSVPLAGPPEYPCFLPLE